MDALGPILVGGYFVGMLVAGTVIRARAGTGVWLRLKVFGPDGFGPAWIATATVCSMVWPVTLAVWLARGRPEPRVVFNEKAVERRRREAAAAAETRPPPIRPAAPPTPRPATPARLTSGLPPVASTPSAVPLPAAVARTGAGVPPVSPVARIGTTSSGPPVPSGAGARTTSYGYTAPPDAVVDGWGCPDRDCGHGGSGVPQRWPHPCPRCGTPTDPTFAEPWGHDARGPFLRAAVAGSDPATREVWVGALAGWEHADALRASDDAEAERARLRARAVLGQVSAATAGMLQVEIVRGCLAHGRTDAAADELLYWSARVRTTGAAADAGRRADCRNLMDGALDFLESPGATTHRWAPEIRRSAVLLRSAVGNVLVDGVDERAVRVLDAAPFPAAAPVAPATSPWPDGIPVARPASPSNPGSAVVPVPVQPRTRAEDPDRVLAAVLAGVVTGSAPVLDAVRTWIPDGSSPADGSVTVDGSGAADGSGTAESSGTTWAGAMGRVRRGAEILAGSSGPGTPDWVAAGPRQRAEWWSERMGAVVAAAVAAASTSGPVGEHASLRPAVSLAGQAFVLCAVAGEFGVADRDELVGLLAEVLFGRTPPISSTEPDPGILADVASRLAGTGTAGITAFTEIAWRLGRSLLTLRTELLDRPEPARRSRLGKVPGLGAVGGFLDERSALREVTASGVAWLETRSTPLGPPSGDPVSRSS